jgi:hypothetical protein
MHWRVVVAAALDAIVLERGYEEIAIDTDGSQGRHERQGGVIRKRLELKPQWGEPPPVEVEGSLTTGDPLGQNVQLAKPDSTRQLGQLGVRAWADGFTVRVKPEVLPLVDLGGEVAVGRRDSAALPDRDHLGGVEGEDLARPAGSDRRPICISGTEAGSRVNDERQIVLGCEFFSRGDIGVGDAECGRQQDPCRIGMSLS